MTTPSQADIGENPDRHGSRRGPSPLPESSHTVSMEELDFAKTLIGEAFLWPSRNYR
jgi:hypothetical protein